MIKPRKLETGSRIAAVSLSWGGPGVFPHRYQAGKKQFEKEFAVSVVETKHALRDPEWLSRNPEARAEDFMAAFSDKSIDGIISTIGGDDSIRILPYLDLGVVRENPKVFMGYSDTTISHAVFQKAGLISFYGPSFMAGFGENKEAPPPTILTRFVRSLAAMGVLENLAAILLGRPGGQIDAKTFPEYDKALLNTVREEYGLESLAIVTNMDFGHTDPMFVLPIGLPIRVDSSNRQVSIRESAVLD